MTIAVFYNLEDTNRGRVTGINYMIELLDEESLNKAILVEDVPEEPFLTGMDLVNVPYINPSTKEMWYEQIEVTPVTPIEIKVDELQKENVMLKKAQSDQDALLMQILLGGMTV